LLKILFFLKDANVHIYSLSTSDSSLTEKQKLSHGGALTSVNFSPDGKYLVATDIAKKVQKIILYIKL